MERLNALDETTSRLRSLTDDSRLSEFDKTTNMLRQLTNLLESREYQPRWGERRYLNWTLSSPNIPRVPNNTVVGTSEEYSSSSTSTPKGCSTSGSTTSPDVSNIPETSTDTDLSRFTSITASPYVSTWADSSSSTMVETPPVADQGGNRVNNAETYVIAPTEPQESFRETPAGRPPTRPKPAGLKEWMIHF